MFLESFKTTFQAIMELVLLGSVGFWLLKRSIIQESGLKCLSDLVVGVFLPFFMFSEMIKKFSFSLYPDWWIFPLYSLLITAVGYACGLLALFVNNTLKNNKAEFLGIVTFQNSGYLPLPLVASLLAPAIAQEMFIYIFLFLLGFNMTIFSFGMLLLKAPEEARHFDFKNMFQAPVVATLLALACVFFKTNRIIPEVVMKPVELLGRCAIPLSILIVGGNLATIKGKMRSHLGPIGYALLIKLIILPLVFLGFIMFVKPRPLVGLLIMLQAAMPPAVFLSVISKKQNYGGELINQAIFYGHLLSIITVPLALALFWLFVGSAY